LLTGAAGQAASLLRPRLAERYRLRLSDRRPVAAARGQRVVLADLALPREVRRAVRGVDAIVHFGGVAVERPWAELLPANVEGTIHLFEAARAEGVRRVVFASSNHVTGFYPRGVRVDEAMPARPDGRYAVTKLFGEALARLYVDKYGFDVLCIRIGNVAEAPADRRRLAIWVSPDDLAALVVLGLERPRLGFRVVYGVSRNRRSFYAATAGRRLGYRPRDDSESFADSLPREPADRSRAARLQGGRYTVVEDVPPRR
jgi:uronate dehydrogenase